MRKSCYLPLSLLKELDKAAEEQGFVFVDYFSSMVNQNNGLKEELGNDGVHPNIAGYTIMEPLIEQGILKALYSK